MPKAHNATAYLVLDGDRRAGNREGQGGQPPSFPVAATLPAGSGTKPEQANE